ncbi:hypothetical protein KIL84_021030 [Mauremys mutica]|uniref:Histone chaperone ASF1B n=1 Tax=Mauremys mutica TaxID=74926 RepID=A0A9D4B100_9SAUR|nr:hypothetical protein KIL84_021030 [Mauremys mutica]
MSRVSVLGVSVLENPSPFGRPLRFQVQFECGEALPHDLEWKIIYVGSAESEEYDQVLDSVLVGPVPAGRHMFVFEAEAPNPSLIPESDAVGVTVVLITCTYLGQEFIRVGYYVNNEYTDPELRENPPSSQTSPSCRGTFWPPTPVLPASTSTGTAPATRWRTSRTWTQSLRVCCLPAAPQPRDRALPSASYLRIPWTACDPGHGQTWTREPKDTATAWGRGSDWLHGGCIQVLRGSGTKYQRGNLDMF